MTGAGVDPWSGVPASGAPQRVDADRGPWPLHGAAASRAAEAALLAVPADGPTPMQRAGLSGARLVLARWSHARAVHVFAGPGHNGGDGWIAAARLHAAGLAVRVVDLGEPDRRPPGAAAARQAALAAGVPVDAGGAAGRASPHGPPRAGSGAVVVVDALLGLGGARALQGALAQAVDTIGAWRVAGHPVLAVDLPSGLHPDTGQPCGGGPCVTADATLALLTLKPGLFTGVGRDAAGEVWLDRLGGSAAGADAALGGRPDAVPRLHAAHKGRFGDVLVVGGDTGMTGAARLAARAALAAGAGRVWASLLDDHADAADPAWAALMSESRAWLAPAAGLAQRTVVCGCGGGAAVRDALAPLLAHAGALVLDADALNAVAADPALLRLLRLRWARGLASVITPHPLEAARLLGSGTAAVQADRIAAALELAARCQAVVVLKGSGSVVAAPGTRPWINPTGNALLATPGSGDVLAGWLAGEWAQRRTTGAAPGTARAARSRAPARRSIGPTLGGAADAPAEAPVELPVEAPLNAPMKAPIEGPPDPALGAALDAARAAVWRHGRAADEALAQGRRQPLTADRLIQAMARGPR